MLRRPKTGARAEYREQEVQRIKDSSTLADKFPQLKALTVELAHFNSDGHGKSGEIKYRVNLEKAKSLFRFDCINSECVRGDFNLSDELTHAIAKHQTTANGEKSCLGWRNRATINTVRCHNILRYKLTLSY